MIIESKANCWIDTSSRYLYYRRVGLYKSYLLETADEHTNYDAQSQICAYLPKYPFPVGSNHKYNIYMKAKHSRDNNNKNNLYVLSKKTNCSPNEYRSRRINLVLIRRQFVTSSVFFTFMSTIVTNAASLFIKVAINQLLNPKEGKVGVELRAACEIALSNLATNSNHEMIFKPFNMAMNSNITPAVCSSLDCLAKLFDYDFWRADDPLVGLMIESISGCFHGEHTDEKIQMHVVQVFAANQALSNAVCVENIRAALHGGILLKAVRIIYNIFLISKSTQVQTIAQVALTQISTTVFNRIPESFDFKLIMKNHDDKMASFNKDGSVKSQSSSNLAEKGSEEDIFDDSVDILVEKLCIADPKARDSQDILREAAQSRHENLNDQITKDAFLIFRAFCKLGMKAISGPESATDLRSQPMRSKLLSLSLIQNSLKNHSKLFAFPSPVLFTSDMNAQTPADVAFIVAVRQYVCLVFTRNIVSIIPQVFDLSMDIFGRLLLDLRFLLKKEIAVMFTKIIIPIIEASTPVTYYQRISALRSLQKTFAKPEGGKLLVELYLNYDCDSSACANDNIWERLVSSLSYVITSSMIDNKDSKNVIFPAPNVVATSITTSSMTNLTRDQVKNLYLSTGDNNELKLSVINLLVRGILQSLDNYVTRQMLPTVEKKADEDVDITFVLSKNKKIRLAEGIKTFNRSAKTGIKFLIDCKIIPSKQPRNIAHFLFNCPGLDKASIGDYLGEGYFLLTSDDHNIMVMQAYASFFNFSGKSFVAALRNFLDAFRLPGEAQKIDRFVLKFAERYLTDNPGSFNSADTAYVLAYSVIMLNTDQYNPQVKNRMTCDEFVRNNRGIDEGDDLSMRFLIDIFEEIKLAEIKLKESVEIQEPNSSAKSRGTNSQVNQTSTKNRLDFLMDSIKKNNGATRDPKSLDQHFKSGVNASLFFEATTHTHVKEMFQSMWMSFLLAISSSLQKTDDINTIITALEGFKHSIHLSCVFNLDLEKKGYMTNLGKYIELPFLTDIKDKNIEACKTLLEIATENGNSFDEGNWSMIVKCVSQLEKIQAGGMTVFEHKGGEQQRQDAKAMENIYCNISAQSVTLSVDRIFTSSIRLSGNSICYFARALCEVSWDEIISSSDKEHPKMYCLQRLIEISHYNISARIRIEWIQIWATIGPHFNQVGCHSNPNVVFFCLDKLRQLASKFMELEELSNFKFQKDFLQPFVFIFENNPDNTIKDMVLTCLSNMIQIKPFKIKSGWKAIFAILSAAAIEKNEGIVQLGFRIAKKIHNEHIEIVLSQNFYSNFVATLTKFCQATNYPKINGQAVKILKEIAIDVSLRSKKIDEEVAIDIEDADVKMWMVTLRNMKNVILNCDLEIRTKYKSLSRALRDLFEILMQNGHSFSKSFWIIILDDIVLPLFDHLRKDSNGQKDNEDTTLWVSTTLVGALMLTIDLFCTFQCLIDISIDSLLDLLMICILQDNNTLSRLGSACITEFVERNCNNLSVQQWSNISERLVNLFQVTTPKELIFEVGTQESQKYFDLPLSPVPSRKEFPKIIVKCVLHLVVIQTMHSIFTSPKVNEILQALNRIQICMLGDALYKSYMFAKCFNENLSLRHTLMKMGFMKTLPNLLKQETFAVSIYLVLLSSIYTDNLTQGLQLATEIEARYIPYFILISLTYNLISQFLEYDPVSQLSSVNAWSPVIESILYGFASFQDTQFQDHISNFYDFFVELLKTKQTKFCKSLAVIFQRVGNLYQIGGKKLVSGKVALLSSLEELHSEENDLEDIASELVTRIMSDTIVYLGSILNLNAYQ